MESSNGDFEFVKPKGKSSIIKVVGVGGGGNNALKHMYERGIYGVDFVICNTDAQTLDNNPVSNKVQLGLSITEGLGAGADPEVGEKAAIESIDDIKAALGQHTKMVFITAGMGGGTGTGAAPVVAKIAKEMGILTVAIVTVPFSFEGKRRLEQAEAGLDKLRENVDSLIVINNDKLRQQFGNLGFKQGFSKADEVLTNAAKGMAEVITAPFTINIDFRDAKSVLQNSGTALMSTGLASGEKRAEEAVRKALDSPLLNDNKITGAKDVLLLILSGSDEAHEATMDEIGFINDYVQEEAGGNNNANIIFGVGTDEELGESIKVLVIATGFAKEKPTNIGTTEKVRVPLGFDLSEREHRPSPFQSRKKVDDVKNQNYEARSVFRLDDDEMEMPNFKLNTTSELMKTAEVEIQTQVYQGDDFSEENHESFDDEDNINLFSYDAYEEAAHDFSFSFEGKSQESDSVNQISEETPVEFSFVVGDSEAKETEFIVKDIPEQEESFSLNTDFSIPKDKEAESAAEEIEGFTFIDKTPTMDSKIQERRNKLKEFNSRYQDTESNNVFENIPAFRRKNINIEGFNASEQSISSYLSEDNDGRFSVKENRFLNKDVD